MPITPKIRQNINQTDDLHFLGGFFSLGPSVIPYVSTHMTINELASYIHTPDEIPGWSDENTQIEALYQRQIDYNRVNKQILPYLLEDNSLKPKFFNSITVALFPYKNNKILNFEDTCFNPPNLRETGTNYYTYVGPITIGSYIPLDLTKPESFSLGDITWNITETAAVAIDGQHRLAACKKLSHNYPEKAQATKVSVILVVPASELGFRPTTSSRDNLLTLLRSIFIDLNKYAKPVSRSRLILLDDADPHALCVRRCIGEKLQDVDPYEPYEYDRTPLNLIDWHSDVAKFDTGPYITTVLALDRIVEKLLGRKPVKDWNNATDIKKQFDAFQSLNYFPTDNCYRIMEEFQNTEEYLRQKSFSYPPEDLSNMQNAFGDMFSEAINKLLTQPKPYKDLILLRYNYGMLSAIFGTWYEAYSIYDNSPEAKIRYSQIVEHISKQDNPPPLNSWQNCLDNEIPPIKSASLFYKVVFQVALFDALHQLWSQYTPLIILDDEQEDDVPPKKSKDNIRSWLSPMIQSFNNLLDKDSDFFHHYYQFEHSDRARLFWLGSAIRPSGSLDVDFTEQGLKRISSWIILITLLQHSILKYKKVYGNNLPFNLDNFLELIEEQDDDFCRNFSILKDKISSTSKSNKGSMTLVAQYTTNLQLDEDYETVSEESVNEYNIRLNHVWNLLRQ